MLGGGCVCAPGYIRKSLDGKCVDESECPEPEKNDECDKCCCNDSCEC